MPIVVNTNIASLIAQQNLSVNTNNVNGSLEKLSSGYKINHASDDPAGLSISETLNSQISGIQTALQNAQEGNSILQVAEGTLSVIGDNLQRIRELTVEAANDTNSSTQRAALASEIKARLNDNQRMVQAAQFNGINLLTGSAVSARLQIGPDASIADNTINIASVLATATATAIGILGAATSTKWGTIGSINITNGSVARSFLGEIDKAIQAISSRRTLIGAYQNQLSSAISNLQLGSQNLTSSESNIRDVDVAAESAKLTQSQILQQASVSILTQANQTPSMVLKLLQ